MRLREHLGEPASGAEVCPEVGRGRDPLGRLCHPVGDEPLDASTAERLHELGLRGGRPHRCLRVHVVGERVHEGPAGLGREGDEPKRRRRELEVTDERITALLVGPLALDIDEFVVDDRPRTEARVGALERRVGVDRECARLGCAREGSCRAEGDALVLGVLELEDPSCQLRPDRRGDDYVAVRGAVLRPQGAPGSVQPLSAHGVKRSSKVEAAEQLEECLALDRLPLRHVERHRGVLDPLAWSKSHALLAERKCHAEELEILGRGLLLARIDAQFVQARLEHLEMHRCAPHLHAVAHHRLTVDVKHEVVDRDEAGVVNVHAEGEEGRPALGDLVVRVPQLLGALRPALEPR